MILVGVLLFVLYYCFVSFDFHLFVRGFVLVVSANVGFRALVRVVLET